MDSTIKENIKEWVTLDNYSKIINEKNKEVRQKKKEIRNNIMNYVESNNLIDNVIQISDGKLKFQYIKSYAPISLKYVEKCLNDCIKNEKQVDILMNYIKENREVKEHQDIKRFYEKK